MGEATMLMTSSKSGEVGSASESIEREGDGWITVSGGTEGFVGVTGSSSGAGAFTVGRPRPAPRPAANDNDGAPVDADSDSGTDDRLEPESMAEKRLSVQLLRSLDMSWCSDSRGGSAVVRGMGDGAGGVPSNVGEVWYSYSGDAASGSGSSSSSMYDWMNSSGDGGSIERPRGRLL